MKEFNTRINFFAATFIGILGFSLIYEIVTEPDLVDKIDDTLMLILGIIGMWWCRKSGYKGGSSKLALWTLGLAVAIKILAIIIEHADAAALGDDLGIIISLVLGFVFVMWQVFYHKKASKEL